MANPKQTYGTAPATGEQWDEARLEAALKNLKDLHIKASHSTINCLTGSTLTLLLQMRQLRSTIPRMQRQLPLFRVSEATKAAVNEVNEYKKLATSPETMKILEHAKQSRKDNPKGIKPWRPSDEPDWLEPST